MRSTVTNVTVTVTQCTHAGGGTAVDGGARVQPLCPADRSHTHGAEKLPCLSAPPIITAFRIEATVSPGVNAVPYRW